jgi:hypothetical protein
MTPSLTKKYVPFCLAKGVTIHGPKGNSTSSPVARVDLKKASPVEIRNRNLPLDRKRLFQPITTVRPASRQSMGNHQSGDPYNRLLVVLGFSAPTTYHEMTYATTYVKGIADLCDSQVVAAAYSCLNVLWIPELAKGFDCPA